MEIKFCFACKEDRPIEEFYLKPNGKYHSWCNDCRKEKKKEWNLNNKEYIEEYKEINKEHIDAKDREYRENNREKLREQSRRF